MDPEVAIRIDGLSKTFKLPHEKYTSVKSVFINFYRRKRTYELQQALKDVSFEIKKGEFFGIIGRNGSGKSTLLKLIAGIYTPTKGEIKISGSLTPFIELGVGFNEQLTGRENVYLNGALLGFNRKEMNTMYKDIVEFAELEKFMDQKLKNYSSGMQVRLAFSIAIRAKSDILLLDEVLAVGDIAFQQKCYDYFSNLKIQNRTNILVSHNMPVIERYCDRAILIEDGSILKIGHSPEVVSMYEDMFLREGVERQKEDRINQHRTRNIESKSVIKIISAKILQNGKKVKSVKAKKAFDVEIALISNRTIDKANIGINVKNHDNLMLLSTDTQKEVGDIKLPRHRKKTIIFKFENILTDGVYRVNVGVGDYTLLTPKLIYREDHVQEFMVKGIGSHIKGLAHPKVEVKLK